MVYFVVKILMAVLFRSIWTVLFAISAGVNRTVDAISA